MLFDIGDIVKLANHESRPTIGEMPGRVITYCDHCGDPIVGFEMGQVRELRNEDLVKGER